MKNNKLIILVLMLTVLLLSGCESYEKKTCTRSVTSSDNSITLDSTVEIYYNKDKYVAKTISVEKLTSNSSETLEIYKKAAEENYSKYKNIKYYDNNITMGNTTLTSKTIIDYRKVDYKKIIEIEGDNGNIFTKDGKVKLDTLIELQEKSNKECK